MVKFSLVLVLCNCLVVLALQSDYDNEICPPDIGICKTVRDCEVARESLIKRHTHSLMRCGFEGNDEVVCCPSQTIVKHPLPMVGKRSQDACKQYADQLPGSPTLLILKGENASIGDFPHMAALGYEREEGLQWDCGGSLIGERHVLTAAHCVVTRSRIKPTKVKLGIVDLTGKDNETPQDFEVTDIHVHQDYDRGSKVNDIAVIVLNRNVMFNENANPACLYTEPDDPQGLLITGWGFTTLNGQKSDFLQKAAILSVDNEQCNQQYERTLSKKITPRQICAASAKGVDACQGDSGGPLQMQGTSGSNIYSIVGITSYGVGCGGKFPGIYTRVSSYVGWIEDLVWPK